MKIPNLAEKEDNAAQEIADCLQRQGAQNSDEEAADRVEAETDFPDPESDHRLAR
jgi:hypothetical protein